MCAVPVSLNSKNPLNDALDLCTDTVEFVEETVLCPIGHISCTIALQTANLRLLLSGVVELVFTDGLANLHKLLASLLPVLGIIVTTMVA